jgi:hypothetical protein
MYGILTKKYTGSSIMPNTSMETRFVLYIPLNRSTIPIDF